jgi:diguanylate cyclase (GGDEF)-like protein
MSGFTIETVIMLASGYMIGKLTTDYFRELFEKENAMQEKIDLLDSMAEIYDNVNLINFADNTEMSLRDEKQEKHGIDMSSQTHTLMNQRIMANVVPDQLVDFLGYTNITTVRERLRNKKLISADFIDVVKGWFRAQYITVKALSDGTPETVIYTTRNVDEEKRREEHLIRISLTDEMTRLFNRRCYEEDLISLREGGLPDDLVLFSIDVNGLKVVNDTKGHAAGDELIKGAADCISLSVGNHGKAYRTGGDEFVALVHTYDPENLRSEMKQITKEWHGVYTDKMSMSIGYASVKENKEASVDVLEHIADQDMYKEKSRYYTENGIERRVTK